MNKRIVAISIFAFSYGLVFPQIINNKISLYLNASYGIIPGKEVGDEDFIYPILYSNYPNLKGLSVKGLVQINNFFAYGLIAEFSGASGWENFNYNYYSDSKIRLSIFTPVMQVSSGKKDTGFTNCIKIFAEAGPTIGTSKIILKKPLFEIQGENGEVSPMTSNDLLYGARGSAGVEVDISQNLGAVISYSFGYYFVNSKLYYDKNFATSQFAIGLKVKFRKEKNYYY